MRLKSSLIKWKSKLSRSCNKFVSFFQDRFRNVNTAQSSSSSPSPSPTSTLLSRLCFLNTNKEHRMNQINPRSSPSTLMDDPNLLHSRKMFPLDLTQRIKKASTSQRNKEDTAKEACTSFENFMIHVMVEEGKMDDLMDMEEVLYYWQNLSDPVFIDLVTRFYGELCIDLFPNDHEQRA